MSAWVCPECGAGWLEHGRGGHRACRGERDDDVNREWCGGLYCGCGGTGFDHGENRDNPCHAAICDHCGWRGTLPVKPKKRVKR